MFCKQCGKGIVVDAKFCVHCGVPINPDDHSYDNKQRKIIYEGDIHKCPNCGEVLKSFTANCPTCGYEIRDIKTGSAIREFTLKLEQIEAQKMPIIEQSFMKRVFGRDFRKNADEEDAAKRRFEEQKEQEKASLIRNFSVPNTKEDILEFMLLVSSNISFRHGVNDTVSKAWITKLDQIYQKAEASFVNDSDFERIKSLYERKKKEIILAKLKTPLLFVGSILLYMILIGLVWNAAVTIAIIIVILGLSVTGFILYIRKKKM